MTIMGAFLSSKRQTKKYIILFLDWTKNDINLKIHFESFKAIVSDKNISLIGYPSKCNGIAEVNSISDLKGKCLLMDCWLQPFKDREFTKLQQTFIDACKQLKDDVSYAGALKISVLPYLLC